MINLGLRLTSRMADFLEERTVMGRCMMCGSPILSLKDNDSSVCVSCGIDS